MKKIKKEEFIDNLRDALEIEDNVVLNPETILEDLEEYDSLSVLVIVAMAENKYGKQIYSSYFKNITTIGNLMKLIGLEFF